ncbi:MAG: hypothetical protein ACRDWT_14870 [Jatrophihabitantaceae bacterium]
MSHSEAVVLIWIGALGLAEFGGLWIAVMGLDRGLLGPFTRGGLSSVVGHRHRRRLERWIRLAPALSCLSIAVIATGIVFRWVGA